MSAEASAALSVPPGTRTDRAVASSRWFWALLFASTWLLSSHSRDLAKALDARWLTKFPRGWELSLDDRLSAMLKWLVNEASFGLFTFQELTRFLSATLELPYRVVRALLIDGFSTGQGQQAVEWLPASSWIAIVAIAVTIAWRVGDALLASLVGLCFLYLVVFGQWQSAMVTLASVLIAVPIGVALGLGLGILAWRVPFVERLLRPLLDLMQTVPVFAYLVPILFLFGFGPVSALVATVIYAMPPMVRITIVALGAVAPETIEAGRMAGCTPAQILRKVQLPSARPALMVGVNQVIMLSLNMVIIASMIGAGGLGYDVLTSLRRLDIGGGVEAGLAIVVMAVALDRTSQALSTSGRSPKDGRGDTRRTWTVLLLIVLGATLAGALLPALATWPARFTIGTGAFWTDAMAWLNVNLFDELERVKGFFLTWLMLPVKRFFIGIPWPWGVLVTAVAVARIGGLRLGLMAGAMMLFVAANGFWDEAMVTLYLISVSVLVASAVGIPLGLWAGQRPRADSVVGVLMDTLQTLPSFVYLIPVVMLFRVGDFSAMIAVILYALAPAVRYAALGIRNVDPTLIEAGRTSGCTEWQLLRRVKLPLAVPSLLLGLNQTIMLALSMLVITALVGTRDLGQEVYIALTRANTGQGIVAGLCIAFIAIIADRTVTALARGARERLGLAP